MALYYNCKDGEMLDAICKAYYGRSRGTVETVLNHALNRELAKKMPVLKAGDVVYLPTITEQPPTVTTLSIWD
tara:strand:- start:7880 stop:8098 length:219 start_codon:yes stop_codon:yes gene_type:complete